MKQTIFLLSLFTTLILGSCNEDIELTGEFKETAVVYAILDKADTVHMIKITRAFIGPGNAIDIAGEADSSYFNQVDAKITEYVGGNISRVWNLQDTIINNKDTNGIFYAPEQKLYYFTTSSASPLISGTNVYYKLDINFNNGEFQVHGTTEIVDGMAVGVGNNANWNYYRFATSDINDYTNTILRITNGNAKAVNASLDVYYKDFIGSTSVTDRSFKWNLGEQEISSGTLYQYFSAKGEVFYQTLANNILANSDPAVDKRNMEGIEVTAVGAGEELYTYMLVNEPSSSLSQNKPTYTNLEVSNDMNVIGVFSSRYTVKKYIPMNASSSFVRCLDINSTDELCTGQYTSSFYFCSQRDDDTAKPWHCN